MSVVNLDTCSFVQPTEKICLEKKSLLRARPHQVREESWKSIGRGFRGHGFRHCHLKGLQPWPRAQLPSSARENADQLIASQSQQQNPQSGLLSCLKLIFSFNFVFLQELSLVGALDDLRSGMSSCTHIGKNRTGLANAWEEETTVGKRRS